MKRVANVLLIEDHERIIRALERLFQGTIKFSVAVSLEEAEQRFPTEKWDFILVDGCLGRNNTLNTLPLITKMRTALPDTLIFACSSSSTNNKLMVHAGATKEIDKIELGREITTILIFLGFTEGKAVT